VSDAVIDGQVAGLDDAESAYRAARARAARLATTDQNIFRKRLGDYLRRRGFDFDLINDTVARVWREVAAGSPERI
jgi:SOS response regulatory protein OraA/RecX